MSNELFNADKAGDLESLMHLFAVTLDDMKAWIEQIVDVLNIDFAKPEHLPVIAAILGFPIDVDDDPVFIRKQLKTAVDWYKTKGTVMSFKILFYNLGFDVDIIPLWTPDYCETVIIGPPYLRLTDVIYDLGESTVIITNPDGQTDTFLSPAQACDNIF